MRLGRFAEHRGLQQRRRSSLIRSSKGTVFKMRTMLLTALMAVNLLGLIGCQANDNPNSPALQAMDNPPNSCGPGGSNNIEDCNTR